MYKYLIIGIACMFFFSGAYYINKAGGGEILIGAIVGGKSTPITPLVLDKIPGMYICDESSGCTSKYVLLLRDDKTAEVVLFNGDENANSEYQNYILDESQQLSGDSSSDNAMPVASDATGTDELSDTTTVDDTGDAPLPEVSKPETTVADVDNLFPSNENEDTTDLHVEKGTWDVAVQNMLVVTLYETGSTTYPVPQKIVVKNVTDNSLSKLSYTKSNFTDMVDPVFIRQQ